MLTRPSGLGDARLADEIRAAWGLRVDAIDHAPVGFGSHHWRVTAGGARWFATVDELATKRRHPAEPLDGPLRRLVAALRTARRLADAGLDFVVAPVPTSTGDVVHRIDGGFAAALYPHVDGEARTYGPYPTSEERSAALGLLVRLHRVDPATVPTALGDDLAIADRDELIEALGDLDRPWTCGPVAEATRALLRRHRDDVRSLVAAHDRLAASVAGSGGPAVLTHGEPHPGNTIVTPRGTVLIDWDTVALAPRERDLWRLAAEDPDVVDEYAARTGVRPDPAALELFRLRWDLADVAAYVAWFRRPHVDDTDTRVAWTSLRATLEASVR